MQQNKYLLLLLSEALIGVGIFFLYIHHVRTVFETRTNFSNLSKLSREAALRKEDALYFSFYKTLVEERDFWQGYKKLLNLTTVEYPQSINIVQRFHVFPELVISFMHSHFLYLSHKLGMPVMTCWAAEKYHHRHESVVSCEGLGEPFYFYLEFVWILGGFTVFILYIYASFLSDTIFGGIYAVLLYIIFHKNAGKIYERPAARENFAFPFIFWQIFYLSLCISKAARIPLTVLERIVMVLKLTCLTTVSLLCWQFSSIIFATQVLIMIIPLSLGFIPNELSVDYITSQFLSSIIAYYMTYENKKYLISWQTGPTLALFLITLARIYKFRARQQIPESCTKNITLGILMAFSSQGTLIDILEKSGYVKANDNVYTTYRDLVLHWSLQRKENFSISLLACNPDFKEVQIEELWELIKTLFIKPYCLYGVVILAKFFRKWRNKDPVYNKLDYIERSKKYVLEDFLEENKISMQTMSNKETEYDLNECFKLLEQCEYDYDKYKLQKEKLKKAKSNERDDFINDVKKLKSQISKNEKLKEKKVFEEETPPDFVQNPTLSEEDTPRDASDSETNKEPKTEQPRKNTRKDDDWSEFNCHYLYSLLQLIMLSLIGIWIKKLFFLCYTQGCVIAPTLCPKFWYKKRNNVFWTISLAVFLISIIDPGFQNLKKEYLPAKTNNEELENMLEWINMNTDKDAVFGGPVEIIGTVHLSTRRPIVNHPHLEMRQVRDRTESVYGIYSRQQSSEIYSQCSQLKLQYLIFSLSDCSNSTEDECDILSIWDDLQPTYRKHPQFCSEIINKNIPSFLKVYLNKHYGIVKIFSQSVQLNLRQNKMPEKVM